MYQVEPVGVVIPRDAGDVQAALDVAHRGEVAVLARGGGTSLTGQTVNRALVLDFSAHMNQVLEVNAEELWARVQPGLVQDELNHHVRPLGLLFGPGHLDVEPGDAGRHDGQQLRWLPLHHLRPHRRARHRGRGPPRRRLARGLQGAVACRLRGQVRPARAGGRHLPRGGEAARDLRRGDPAPVPDVLAACGRLQPHRSAGRAGERGVPPSHGGAAPTNGTAPAPSTWRASSSAPREPWSPSSRPRCVSAAGPGPRRSTSFTTATCWRPSNPLQAHFGARPPRRRADGQDDPRPRPRQHRAVAAHGLRAGRPRAILIVEYAGDSDAEVRAKVESLEALRQRQRFGYAATMAHGRGRTAIHLEAPQGRARPPPRA